LIEHDAIVEESLPVEDESRVVKIIEQECRVADSARLGAERVEVSRVRVRYLR